ncbi:MAG: 2-oxoglutarate dehydrogenase complex dihydrolipoyllysine-residue succinyltransferase [Pseudomonadota bacterium]|nr:2-oxoglutarate dehydrogenase complex dihydrolipoyllysine-residue succinyltransferase [Alphaproteobacteria bacterium]MDP5370089.1 2-oxoglutarate dehydrogenase complex dihydrolipoyllysine-residue succinyltransferase [Pseudomonadota bacterium]
MSLVEIKVPVLGESVSEASIAKWRKKVGEAVIIDEVLVELETDKVTLEITAPASGVLAVVRYERGATVKIGNVLGGIDVNAVASVAAPTVASVAPPVASEKVAVASIISPAIERSEPIMTVKNIQPTPEIATHLSPAVRKHLGDNQLNAANVKTSSPDGRLSKADVLNHVQNAGQRNVATEAAAPNSLQSDDRLEVRTPMSRLRLRVSERLKYAQNTAAILTTFNEIDMTAVKQLRDRYKDVFEKKYGIKLGFMSFFVKACTQALKEIPMVNSRIEGDEIVTNNYCDIGVAVSAPTGLVVPVVRDVDLLDLAGIERAVAEYGRRAKDGKLTMEEMSGGTFTISNGGVFGSLFSTPIINPPQSAILGMHKIQDRPMAINGHVEIRPMMYVALSYDHRLIDGREAVTFLATIKDCIENPGRFLLEI